MYLPSDLITISIWPIRLSTTSPASLSPLPKMITMHIDPDKIREVIGKGGSVIQKIVAESGAKIDIDDDGRGKADTMSASAD